MRRGVSLRSVVAVVFNQCRVAVEVVRAVLRLSRAVVCTVGAVTSMRGDGSRATREPGSASCEESLLLSAAAPGLRR